jgi:PRTRC genetic system ThiF family protein
VMLEHSTHPAILAERVHVALAGAGGSGSLMLSGLARLDAAIRALGHPGLDVTVYDPDTVSEANLGRQLFARADVGQNKAAVLVTRTNAWFGTRWAAVAQRFNARAETPFDEAPEIVVSCVDSARARLEIGRGIASMGRTPYYWLDLGNRAADGQVVLGVPPASKDHETYAYRLPTVLELFPELASAEKLLDRDPGPSCSLAQALERQELFVNQAVATPALQLLWQIFRTGRTSWCAAFVNCATGRMTPLPVDPEAWKRFGHHADRGHPQRCTVPGPAGEQVWIEKYTQDPAHVAALEAMRREEEEAAA